MQEHEVKILEIDEGKVEERLKQLGASLVFDGDLFSIYFNREIDVLRLRKLGDKVLLTHKFRKEGFYDETEVLVDDFDSARLLLGKLGLEEYATDFRRRKSFKVGNFRVDMDFYEDIPCFIEIEAESREELEKGIKLLGFSLEDAKFWSGKQVKEYYNI
ncbi:CYTH domain-containing protein [Candidatus Woesearchaeota archaeon]|nr:CYTH domain-containing protein [Candidatus Woesearchaeota archaeon]MBW3021470.1 CYTH domain-containing protein [Candidatus Woesearchaeota archaeon]